VSYCIAIGAPTRRNSPSRDGTSLQHLFPLFQARACPSLTCSYSSLRCLATYCLELLMLHHALSSPFFPVLHDLSARNTDIIVSNGIFLSPLQIMLLYHFSTSILLVSRTLCRPLTFVPRLATRSFHEPFIHSDGLFFSSPGRCVRLPHFSMFSDCHLRFSTRSPV